MSSPAIEAAAEELYGKDDVTAYPGNDTAFAQAFPALDLWYVFEPDRKPAVTHAMVHDPNAGVGEAENRDFTDAFNSLIEDPISSSDRALELAKAFAQVGNAEMGMERQVVNASDESWLETTGISDPAVTSTIDGWKVELQTWSEENGILADWDLEFSLTELQATTAYVDATGIGPFSMEMYATNLRSDTRILNTWAGEHELDASVMRDGGWHEMDVRTQSALPTSGDQLAQAQNYDTSTWTVVYDGVLLSEAPNVQAFGEAYAEAGVDAYEIMTEANLYAASDYCDPDNDPNPAENWEFVGRDTDCTYKIVVHNLTFGCFLCVEFSSENSTETILHVSVGTHDALTSRGYYAGEQHNTSTIAQSLTANMYFRYLDYVNTGWESYMPAARDGLALAAQAAAFPDVEHDPSSLFYGQPGDSVTDLNDASDFQRFPDAGFCEGNALIVHQSSYALFWADTFSDHFQGDSFYGALSALGDDASDQCTRDVIGNATYNATEHCETRWDPSWCDNNWDWSRANKLMDVFRAFGMDMYAKKFNWTFGDDTREWGSLLPEVAIQPQVLYESNQTVGGWSLTFVNVTATGTYTLDCWGGSSEGPDWWSFQLLKRDASGQVTNQTVDCADPPQIDGDQWDEVVFNAFRPHHTDGSFHVDTVTS